MRYKKYNIKNTALYFYSLKTIASNALGITIGVTTGNTLANILIEKKSTANNSPKQLTPSEKNKERTNYLLQHKYPNQP